jgi:hypothetical protein
MKNKTYYLLILLITFSVEASIRLDISVLHQRGVDKNLILVSELHTQEIVDELEELTLEMSNGVKLIIIPKLIVEHTNYGPNVLFQLSGFIPEQNDITVEVFNFEKLYKLDTKIEKKIKPSEDQIITISILPSLQIN